MPHIRVELSEKDHTALKVKAAKEKKSIKDIVKQFVTNYTK